MRCFKAYSKGMCFKLKRLNKSEFNQISEPPSDHSIIKLIGVAPINMKNYENDISLSIFMHASPRRSGHVTFLYNNLRYTVQSVNE